MRRRARIDANQPAIVRALRVIGCSVLSLAELGKGKPDILAALGMRSVLFEIKNDDGKTGTDESAAGQSAFAAAWQGEIYTVRTPEEAVEIMVSAPFQRGTLGA